MQMNNEIIDKLVKMMKHGIGIYMKQDGFVVTMAFLAKDNDFTNVPVDKMKLYETNKNLFYEFLRMKIKEFNLDAVAFISEAWFVNRKNWNGIENPSECKDKQNAVYFTIDTKERQVSFMAIKKEGKLGRWKAVMDYDKTKPTDKQMGGLSFDLFGSGMHLGLPSSCNCNASHVKSDVKIA